MRRITMLTSQRGFTLIEAMISMIILLLSVLAMLAVVPFGFNSVQANSINAQAVAVGQQYLEDERNALLQDPTAMPAPTSVPIDPGHSFIAGVNANTNYGSFAVNPDGCVTKKFTGSTSSAVNTYSCSVTVSWTETSAAKSVTVQSYATK